MQKGFANVFLGRKFFFGPSLGGRWPPPPPPRGSAADTYGGNV